MNIKLKLVKLIKYLYPRYGLKDTDIILATFPKSGTTWFRFIYANLISIQELNGREVDYVMLNEYLNSSYDGHIYPKIRYKSLPRLVATHSKYNEKSFMKNKKIFLYRNPYDTMVSYWEYIKGYKKFKNEYDFKEFIRSKEYGIEAWIIHFLSWLKEADIVFTYEDLKSDELKVLLNVVHKFNIKIYDVKLIKEAIMRSRFDKIRSIENERGIDNNSKNKFQKGFKFARKGTVGQWKNYFDQVDINYTNNKLKEYNLHKAINIKSIL